MERRPSSTEEDTILPLLKEQELDENVAEIIQNKDLDIYGRIELARQYVEQGKVVSVPVMTLLTMDGMTTNDDMRPGEFTEFRDKFGFENNTYVGNQYDARTPSQKDKSLTMRITEKGIQLPGWSESFPGGYTHSIYDNQVDVYVLVSTDKA